MTKEYRIEVDGIGKMPLSEDILYGIHTARACQNFPITNVPVAHFPSLVNALAMVKLAAAKANAELDVLPLEKTDAIINVCQEIYSGQHHEHFVVDMIQGGAGTSTNMNANEVIANVALQKLGYSSGDYKHMHPNDHVNCSQSTNDVYPTAIRVAILTEVDGLCDALANLQLSFRERAVAFADIHKVGRTQLQDAVPMLLGDEFESFAVTVGEDIQRVRQIGELLTEVNLGGTAIGTSLNTPEGYGEIAIAHLAQLSGFDLKQASNLIEASSDLGAFVTFSSVLKRIAVKLSKICNDLRLLSSGPRAGLGEIILPAVQAGSSIMPGKINPVIPEVVNQVAYEIIGNDLTVTLAAEAGQLQLNAMEPIVVYKILESIRILGRAIIVLTDKCVSGIEADEKQCSALLANSLVLATALVPHIGYDIAASIAKKAQKSGRSIFQVASDEKVLPIETLKQVLLPTNMCKNTHRIN